MGLCHSRCDMHNSSLCCVLQVTACLATFAGCAPTKQSVFGLSIYNAVTLQDSTDAVSHRNMHIVARTCEDGMHVHTSDTPVYGICESVSTTVHIVVVSVKMQTATNL